MPDRQFLRLTDRWALGCDSLQWILQRRQSANGKPETWRGVSFIASNRDVLVLTLREKGIVPDPVVTEKIMALPYTFNEWMAYRLVRVCPCEMRTTLYAGPFLKRRPTVQISRDG